MRTLTDITCNRCGCTGSVMWLDPKRLKRRTCVQMEGDPTRSRSAIALCRDLESAARTTKAVTADDHETNNS